MRYLNCYNCNQLVKNVGDKCVKVLCYKCTQNLLSHNLLITTELKEKQSTYPSGWRKLELFVDNEHNVYMYGDYYPQHKNKYDPTEYVPKEIIIKPTKKARVSSKKTKKEIQEEIYKTINNLKENNAL